MQNNIRTDLAVELNEEISRKAGRLKGIIVNQQKDKDTGIEAVSYTHLTLPTSDLV